MSEKVCIRDISYGMMERVFRERPMFVAMHNAPDNNNIRHALVKKLSPSQVKAIALVALNVLHGSIGVAEKKKKQLSQIKNFLRSLTGDDKSTSKRKRILLKNLRDTFLLVNLLYTNLDLLIWRDENLRKKAK